MERNEIPLPPGVHAETKLRENGYTMSGHHCHECCELFYVETGACRFLVNDNLFDLHAGDFILIPPLVLHYTRYVFGPCRRTVILFQREDAGEEVCAFLPHGEGFFAHPRIFQVPEMHQAQVIDYISRMAAEEKISDPRSRLLLRLGLQSLLLLCSRVCAFLRESPPNIHTTDPQILKAASFITEHYMQPVTTAEIAAAAGFSPNYLSRKFREATGVGLHEYLVFIRLQHAALELVSTGDSITEIALRCGFSDSNYFKDAFKKKYGMTPRSYRKLS